MLKTVLRAAKWSIALICLCVAIFLGVRIVQSQRGLPLDIWHTYVPDEFDAAEIEDADFASYLGREEKIFSSLRENVTQKLSAEERVPFNRYFEDSPVYPGKFVRDWNRSYIQAPDGPPSGAVVLLHGLTDSPYSLRHIAAQYHELGFAVVAIRLPAHGTVPAALTDIDWRAWLAATRLSVREARRLAPAPSPLHIVGFSNGGTLALKYALDAIENASLPQADRLILISPMVGVTRFARFAGLAGLPAMLPAFAKAAWLGIMPEFNPFKYNSFPVNGARQAYGLTDSLGTQISRLRQEGKLIGLPAILTFHSVVDFTVSTPALVSGLYDFLPANNSELVLFDVNRSEKFGPLIRPSADAKLSTILPPRVRNYRVTVIENAGDGADEAHERVIDAGAAEPRIRRLGLSYPKGVFSLSHVALPFPLTDALYGLTPDESEDFGIKLGSLAPRGERNTLIVSLDALLRMSSNPFFPYLKDRIRDLVGARIQKPEQAPPLVEDAQPAEDRPSASVQSGKRRRGERRLR